MLSLQLIFPPMFRRVSVPLFAAAVAFAIPDVVIGGPMGGGTTTQVTAITPVIPDVDIYNRTLLGEPILAREVVTRNRWGTPMPPNGKGGYSLIAPLNPEYIAQSLVIPPLTDGPVYRPRTNVPIIVEGPDQQGFISPAESAVRPSTATPGNVEPELPTVEASPGVPAEVPVEGDIPAEAPLEEDGPAEAPAEEGIPAAPADIP